MNFPKSLPAIFIGSTAVLCALDKHIWLWIWAWISNRSRHGIWKKSNKWRSFWIPFSKPKHELFVSSEDISLSHDRHLIRYFFLPSFEGVSDLHDELRWGRLSWPDNLCPIKKLIWSLITHLSYIEDKHGKIQISEIIWPCLDDADLFSIKSFQFPHKFGKIHHGYVGIYNQASDSQWY